MDPKQLELDRAQGKQAEREKTKLQLFRRLSHSIADIHIDPVPERGADGVATFLDRHSVIHEYEGDRETSALINTWLRFRLKQKIATNDRLAGRIFCMFGDKEYRVEILDHDHHGQYERYWFVIVAK